MQDRDVNAQIWGITYTQIWAKKGQTEFKKFCYTLRYIMKLPPSYRLACYLVGNYLKRDLCQGKAV